MSKRIAHIVLAAFVFLSFPAALDSQTPPSPETPVHPSAHPLLAYPGVSGSWRALGFSIKMISHEEDDPAGDKGNVLFMQSSALVFDPWFEFGVGFIFSRLGSDLDALEFSAGYLIPWHVQTRFAGAPFLLQPSVGLTWDGDVGLYAKSTFNFGSLIRYGFDVSLEYGLGTGNDVPAEKKIKPGLNFGFSLFLGPNYGYSSKYQSVRNGVDLYGRGGL